MIKTLFFLTISLFILSGINTNGQTTEKMRMDSTSITSNSADDSPVVVPTPDEKTMQYYHSGNILWVTETIWGILFPLVLLFTGFSAKMRTWSERISKRKFVLVFVYVIIFILINFIVDFALDYYSEFIRPHAYGLSDQTFGKWLGDSFKSMIVSIIFGGLVINLLYLILKKSPKRWWLYMGILTVPLMFFLLIITPIFIEPLFNDFGPMKDKVLEGKILALAHKAGIEGSNVYEVNKSEDTKTLNAYVTGFGSTKRIVLWDNTIKQLDENQLLFVMGHEMGHYVLGHVVSTVLFMSLVMILTLFAAWRTSNWFIRKYSNRFGFTDLADIASFPLILLVISIYSFILSPISNTYSRMHEHESDIFGLEITKNNHAAASAFVKLQNQNLSNPRPDAIIRFFRANHPTLGERIDFCNSYKPWKTGEKMRFDSYFKD